MNNAYKKYSMYLLLSLILTFVGTFIGGYIQVESIYSIMIVSLILIFAFMFTKGTLKKILFYVFCLGEGITLTPILMYYTDTDIMGCLLITVITVAIFLFIGLKAKNLGFMGGVLFIGLISLVLYQIVQMFIPLPSIALLGVVIFSGYIAYDINRFKLHCNSGYLTNDDILNHVMNMYLNLLNIFLYLLRLFGGSDD